MASVAEPNAGGNISLLTGVGLGLFTGSGSIGCPDNGGDPGVIASIFGSVLAGGVLTD